MAIVSEVRDNLYAQRGYLRASMVAALLGLTTSGASRIVYRKEITKIVDGRVCWVEWADFLIKSGKQADVLGLPNRALDALAEAKKRKAEQERMS